MRQRLSALGLAVVLAASALLVLVPVHEAVATTAVRLSDAQLAEKSDVVVLAEVISQETSRGDDGQIYTVSTLRIEQVLAGEVAPGDEVRVRQLGGTVEGETRFIPGDAVLDRGERSVFFLADRTPGEGVLFLTALSQSVLEVVGALEGGDLILGREYHGLTFYDAAKGGELYVVDTFEPVTLSQLQTIVEEAAR